MSSPEFLRFPADQGVLAHPEDPEGQIEDRVMTNVKHTAQTRGQEESVENSPAKTDHLDGTEDVVLTKFPFGPWGPSPPRTP